MDYFVSRYASFLDQVEDDWLVRAQAYRMEGNVGLAGSTVWRHWPRAWSRNLSKW